MRLTARLITGLLGFFWVAAATAQCALPNMRTDERPGDPVRATEITVSFIVNDILGVDDVNQQLNVDILGRILWVDPRLEGLEGCRYHRTQVWVPDIFVYNSSNLRTALNEAREQVTIKEGGVVSYRQRFIGSISSYHNLRRFPFDNHDFEIDFGPVHSTVDEMLFHVDRENTWVKSRLNIEGWSMQGVSIGAAPLMRETDGTTVNVVTLTISASRDAGYYVFRILLPLVFVVGMSWFIFWIPPSHFEFQIGLGATSMLTSIAFKTAVSATLPPLGYLTVLDKMLMWAIFLVFLSMTQALITGHLVYRDKEDQALRLDRVCRVAGPALLILGWLLFWRGIV